MDYSKVYRDFIVARKAIEHTLEGYTERHHIVPKSLGGSNDAANLVKLTPEDHFFAHLLLAKIHGRGMWVAVRRMRWGRVGGERPWVRGRYMYAVARRKHAQFAAETQTGRPGLRGAENGRYDHTLREWSNMDTGEKITATTDGMWRAYGGSRAHWASAVSGARKTMKGWTPSPDRVAMRSNKGKVAAFTNRDGREFVGTQSDFIAHSGVNAATASRLIRGNSVSVCGWRRSGVNDRSPNCPMDGSKPGPAGEVFVFKKDGKSISGNRSDIAAALGVTSGCVSASISAIRAGKSKSYKGWFLDDRPDRVSLRADSADARLAAHPDA